MSERMNPEIKAQWVAALRSGEYKQGTGRLHLALEEGAEKMCCLGVLSHLAYVSGVCDRQATPCNVYAYGREGNTATLPQEVTTWSGLDDDSPYVNGLLLTVHNDGDDTQERRLFPKSFLEIADLIEEHL
jgi:hypothetical protein